jgi:polyferredoxin
MQRAAGSARVGTVERRSPLPKVLPARRIVQWVTTAVVVVIGIRFTQWVVPHLDGRWPTVDRPPGVEAFLPIGGMLATRHLLEAGVVDAVHPAGLAIFLGICLMSTVIAKSFCSHLCPVGLLSELLGRLGVRLVGRNLRAPRWLDLPLRSLKFLLLGFFAWAIWFAMDVRAVSAFLESPYNTVVDAKMWLFFASPSRLTLSVVGVLVVGSVFVRDLWCRYLCPYGALVGLLGLLAPLKVTRDEATCTGCQGCTKACPAALPVHRLRRVASVECTSCQDCVVACPVKGCLAVRPPQAARSQRWLRPVTAAVVAVAIYCSVVVAFRAAGRWQTQVTEAEYHARLQDIHSPAYVHPGGAR